jgi:hypothetical protein
MSSAGMEMSGGPPDRVHLLRLSGWDQRRRPGIAETRCVSAGRGEYRYTDVSVFLVHGEKAYGAGRGYHNFAVVDVEG